jgi:ATP-dependent RNA helicase DDX3X
MEDVATDVQTQKGNTNAEAAALARERGWVEPQQYNYGAYNAPSKPDEDASDLPAWASSAAKYEWNESYGDIGPPDPKLEEMLFHSEYLNRAGIKFDRCVFLFKLRSESRTNIS